MRNWSHKEYNMEILLFFFFCTSSELSSSHLEFRQYGAGLGRDGFGWAWIWLADSKPHFVYTLLVHQKPAAAAEGEEKKEARGGGRKTAEENQ